MPKKILIFSTSYYPFVGGAEVAIKEITDRIPDTQFDLITGKFDKKLPKKEKIGNVNIYRLGFGFLLLDKLLLPFWGAIFALRLNRKNKYNYFWCMMAFCKRGAYIANILKFGEPIPIILTLQEGDSEEHFKNSRLGLIDLSWRLALKNKNTKILTVLSSYLRDRAKRLGYKKEIKIIPNGVNVNLFSKELPAEEKYNIRESWGVKKYDIILVTSSRLNVKNGVQDVIMAIPKLPQNIKFVIFGEGELKEKLVKLVSDLNVSKRVIFKGFVEHSVLNKYLKACDIFIRPSLSEGFGNSFIEAMATKIPVIATPVGGIVDFLRDGETGYFCKPGDSNSVAEAVNRVINDAGKNRVVDNAYRMIVEKYDWDLIASQMKRVFVSILK